MNDQQWQSYGRVIEKDACGIGAIVDLQGRQSCNTVDDALTIVENDYGVGMFFFPQSALHRGQAKKMFEIITEKEGLHFLGWREVPVHPEILGETARSCMPAIWQCFIERPADIAPGFRFDQRLYVIRREFEQSNSDTYVTSLSSRSIVYKGMFLVSQLRNFYLDLQCGEYASAIAMVHSRFSTNTTPSWERAHPNRFLLHNGEINTIRGNVDRMLAREETMSSELLQDNMDRIYPVIASSGSDSAMLDNTIEFLVMNGIDLPLAMMMTIPEPWKNDKTISRKRRDMYRYYATMMEPWDGPASILFSDGVLVGAILDRNGLRPSRYYLTDDHRLILSSRKSIFFARTGCTPEKCCLQTPGAACFSKMMKSKIYMRPASLTGNGWIRI